MIKSFDYNIHITKVMLLNNDLETLELNEKSNLIAVDCKCPNCGDKYLHGVPYVIVPCKKCGSTYKTDFNQDIYTKKARQLLSKLSYKNGIIIKATNKYEGAIIHIRQHFIEQHCWEVSEITKSTEEYRRCLCCGVCLNCYTCKIDGTTFERDRNRRKQQCPKCKKSNFVKTYFKMAKCSDENKEIVLCPHCGSDNIRMTRTKNKTQCHSCTSKKLSEKKTNTVYEIIIERKKAYRRENI